MKRAAYRHPKMLALASRLAIPRTQAIGIIEVLLDYTAEAAPQGNIGKWPDGAIAEACDWDGDPSSFVSVLVETGWLDRCARHRLVVHDLAHHAQSWWVAKLRKLDCAFLSAVKSVRTRRKTLEGNDVAERSEKPLKSTSEGDEKPLKSTSEASSFQAFPSLSQIQPLPLPGVIERIPDRIAEARRLAKLYRDTVTFKHGFGGSPEIRSLLDEGQQIADIEASILHAAEWCKREVADPQMRIGAKRFFGEGQWLEFVDSVPNVEGAVTPEQMAVLTQRMLDARDSHG